MEWFLAFVFAGGFVLFTLFRNKSGAGALEKRPEPKIPAGSKDDFAGNTVGSLFLLDELVDNPQTDVKEDDIIFKKELLFFDSDHDDRFFE